MAEGAKMTKTAKKPKGEEWKRNKAEVRRVQFRNTQISTRRTRAVPLRQATAAVRKKEEANCGRFDFEQTEVGDWDEEFQIDFSARDEADSDVER